jgi:adenylate kinase family enzyme
MTPETADDGWIYGGPERRREAGPDEYDRLANEIVLMLLPRDKAKILWIDLPPEIRQARIMIAGRYRYLKGIKGTHPFAESELRAKAEVVAEWLKRRLKNG